MSPSDKEQQKAQEEEAKTQEQKEFESLLAQYDYDFNRGDLVNGKVIGYESSGLMVDIGAKCTALVPMKEISLPPGKNLDEHIEIGSEHEFYLLREDQEDEKFILSLKRVTQAITWKTLEEQMEKDEVVEGTVASVVKGGILVDVEGVRGFVPSSHLRVRQTFESLVGTSIPLRILSLDKQSNNLILSHRKVVAEQMAEQRKELFTNITKGDKIEGEVVRLTDFGAFVDLGGLDGLLPLSQMSWRWVEHPSDILSVGDKVTVEVIGIDNEKQRVSLSIKSQFEDPWNEVMKELKLGDEVEGTINRIKHFGAFVEIYPGVEALLPNRDVQDQEHQTGNKLEVGQKITVHIVKFSPGDRRISLSFRAFESNQPQQIEQNTAPPQSDNEVSETEEANIPEEETITS